MELKTKTYSTFRHLNSPLRVFGFTPNQIVLIALVIALGAALLLAFVPNLIVAGVLFTILIFIVSFFSSKLKKGIEQGDKEYLTTMMNYNSLKAKSIQDDGVFFILKNKK